MRLEELLHLKKDIDKILDSIVLTDKKVIDDYRRFYRILQHSYSPLLRDDAGLTSTIPDDIYHAEVSGPLLEAFRPIYEFYREYCLEFLDKDIYPLS